MTDQLYSYHATDGVPLKLWDSHARFEEKAMQQLRDVASLPFVFKHVAGMPDVHYGFGATIGSVIATRKAVVPAAVGVDIGCGMIAVQTSLTANDLPDSLGHIRASIEKAVPHGRTNNGRPGDRGAWGDMPRLIENRWSELLPGYERIIAKHPKVKHRTPAQHVGTLGTGNHFIEICLDENDSVWVMLHSGSRGVGNAIGRYFIEQAKREMEKYFLGDYIPNKDLAFLVEKSDIFKDYIEAVEWAQRYALTNRETMMRLALDAFAQHIKRPLGVVSEAINCHHNYISRENHFGENVIVTRKGAVRARKGDLGIIPGSMGTGSFIVRGLGNADSFCSCSHGAGRVMSRAQAKRTITLEDHATAMRGIEARLDADVIDESPAAYKPIGEVMAAQSDLVEIAARLRQVVNVKG
ncbi:MAG: RNA-splicing ligase RtcB [Rhodobiaceae bacterium]|nr:MAG: RNA-splicing ligase RtcB [Rhodobiaceae bacterium]